jgi:hypothetical protein
MSYVVLDFETYYDKDYSLRKMTPVEYILDPRFEVIGCAVIERNGEYDTAHPSNIYTTKSYWLDADQFQRYVRARDLIQARRRLPQRPIRCLDPELALRRRAVEDRGHDGDGAGARLCVHRFKVSLEAVAEHLGLPPKGTTIKNVSGMHAADIKAAGLWDAYTAYANMTHGSASRFS